MEAKAGVTCLEDGGRDREPRNPVSRQAEKHTHSPPRASRRNTALPTLQSSKIHCRLLTARTLRKLIYAFLNQ